jgi:hypothetical protein
VLKHLSDAFKSRDEGKGLLVARRTRSLIDVYEIYACGKDPDQQLPGRPDWVTEASQNQLTVISKVL